jgi:hypothetical protein
LTVKELSGSNWKLHLQNARSLQLKNSRPALAKTNRRRPIL